MKDILMSNNKYDHSLKLLQQIIINISKNEINNINIKQIEQLLYELESNLTTFYQTKYNEIIKNKIKIINNSVIANLYNEDIYEVENRINNLKEILKKELIKLDKYLSSNLEIYNKEIIEIKKLFTKTSINKLIEDIDLEETKKLYLKELYSDPFEEEYTELFTAIENKSLAITNSYPILKVVKKLSKYYPNKYAELEKQSIKVANLSLKSLQLANLNKSINLHGFAKTSNYINKSLKKINNVIHDNTKIISSIINDLTTNINDLTEIDQQIITDILNEILSITKEEAQLKYRYQEYSEFLDEAILDYQKFLLSTKYNINFSIEDILNEIKDKKNQTPISKAPKAKLTKKLKKIRVIRRKKK